MARFFLVFVGLLLLISACTQRLACPAYQSAFIYDKDAIKQKFSYFNEDSTPKMLTASKSKYLIAVPESYRKKYRRMQTIEMKPIYPKKPEDSVKEANEFALAELDEMDSVKTDSTAVGIAPGDSTYAITKTKEKFNLDQDLYMWYFREMLVLPDVRAAMESNSEKKKEEASGGKEAKKEKVGFFKSLKNIFKKKEKTDSTGAPVKAELKPKKTDVESPEPEKKKKGGLFKKKDKEKSPVEEVPKKETPKKKDDGFD